MMYRYLTALFCLCLTMGIALGQTAGTAVTNQAGLAVKVTETGSDLPVQMATVYIVPQGDTVAVFLENRLERLTFAVIETY